MSGTVSLIPASSISVLFSDHAIGANIYTPHSRPDTEESFNQDFDALKKSVKGNEDVIHAITVGSEALYRGDMKAQDLLKRINQVKKEFDGVQVGMVDSWNKFADGTADPIIQGGVTYL